jgi:succinate dehydrogenase / fumarate reductase, membrane anchor subunit
MVIELLTRRYPGMRVWLMQRLTGLVMAVYSVMLVARAFNLKPQDYQTWLMFFEPWWLRAASLLFWISLTIHARLGIRDVLKDYVPNAQLRTVMQNVVAVLLWVYLAWATWLFCTF